MHRRRFLQTVMSLATGWPVLSLAGENASAQFDDILEVARGKHDLPALAGAGTESVVLSHNGSNGGNFALVSVDLKRGYGRRTTSTEPSASSVFGDSASGGASVRPETMISPAAI